MTIEIICIGDELLSGRTLNTNATYIAQLLTAEGYLPQRSTVLPDENQALREGIFQAMRRSCVVITTGGLGPTGDDLTVEILANIFGVPLIVDEDVAADLHNRYGDHPTLIRQATIPKGAQTLANRLGSAPGLILKNQDCTVICLPGVPSQMLDMLKLQVMPYLNKNEPKDHREQAIFFSSQSEAVLDPHLRILEQKNPGLKIGICPNYGTVSVFLATKDPKINLDLIAQQIIDIFPTYFFSRTSNKIELAVHETMLKNKKTLILAESCTGGEMAARLSKQAGASGYFLGSIVAYSNTLKHKALGVLNKTLEDHGAVSEETAGEMALGALNISGADYAIAISGIAGPGGGSKEKPVGLICAAIAEKNGQIFTAKFMAKGKESRTQVIDFCTTYLLASFWRYLNHQIEPFLM